MAQRHDTLPAKEREALAGADLRREAKNVDLEELLNKQIVLLEQAQSGLKNALQEGYGTDAKSVKALQELSRAITGAVDTKLKWVTTMRRIGGDMTDIEKDRAAIDRVKGMETYKRARALREIAELHSSLTPKEQLSRSTAASVLADLGDAPDGPADE